MIEIIIGDTAKELKDRFDEFKSNNYEAPFTHYSGGKRKIIKSAECTARDTDFIMTVSYYWREIPARY